MIDKPEGPTSHAVVASVRRALGTRSVGHTGTLDPFATGLLVLLVGRATRLARFVEQQPKTYVAAVRLGFATTTDDRTGQPLGLPSETKGISRTVIAEALAGLVGRSRQRPPAFSAKRVGGQRSYAVARRGGTPELAPVEVTVHTVEPLLVEPPDLHFRAVVSAGTYMRALARDLGEQLGIGAHLTALRREAVGLLRVEQAIRLDQVSATMPLRSIREVLAHLPAQLLDADARNAVSHGRAVPGSAPDGAHVALLDTGGVVGVAIAEGGWLRPQVVLEQG